MVYTGRKLVSYERDFCLFQTEIRKASCAALFQPSSCQLVKQTKDTLVRARFYAQLKPSFNYFERH